jgi:hypothetical protein
MILERMTIDRKLFKKELIKAYKRLSEADAYELYSWGTKKYPDYFLGLSPQYLKNPAL